jgi:periplasmic protein CpxP/Spy
MRNSTNKTLLVIIAVLLLTNIAVLGYFLWYKKPATPIRNDREHNGISDALQKEVGFSDDQVAQYKLLKDKQREIIRPMFDDMRKSKDSLFRLLSVTEVNDSVLNKVTDVIAQKQKMLDLQTFYHFKRVRALCKPDQEAKYDSMVVRMFRKMGRPRSEQEKAEKEKKN